MKSKTKIIIFSLLILVLSISAASAHENIIADGNDAVNDIMDINYFDDGLDENLDDLDDSDLDDEDYADSDDWTDDDWTDDDWTDDDWDDSDDWTDDDWTDDDWDDFDLDDEDYDVFDDWTDGVWDGNYTNSSIKFYKLISYSREPLIAYKTTSSLENMSYGNSSSEDDCEEIGSDDSDEMLDDNSDDLNDDFQEESGLEDLQSFMTACPGASACFEVPDVLSENHESVSKSINQGQNLLDDEKEDSVNVTDDKDYDTITFSSDNDLDILGLFISLLLSIILII